MITITDVTPGASGLPPNVVFVLPQLLLCGRFVPRPLMPGPLRVASDVLPLIYAVDAMQRVADGLTGTGLALDLTVTAASVAGAVALAPLTLRRRTL